MTNTQPNAMATKARRVTNFDRSAPVSGPVGLVEFAVTMYSRLTSSSYGSATYEPYHRSRPPSDDDLGRTKMPRNGLKTLGAVQQSNFPHQFLGNFLTNKYDDHLLGPSRTRRWAITHAMFISFVTAFFRLLRKRPTNLPGGLPSTRELNSKQSKYAVREYFGA